MMSEGGIGVACRFSGTPAHSTAARVAWTWNTGLLSSPMKRRLESEAWPDCVDQARHLYNRPMARVGALDARAMEAVAAKSIEFCRNFSQRARFIDLLSQKAILGDASQIRSRYQTVFRESGESLQMTVRARAVFQSPAPSTKADVVVLDLERHTSLVTPMGALDGSRGLRGPRQQDLWALYAVSSGKIDTVWLSPAGPPAGTTGGGGGAGGGASASGGGAGGGGGGSSEGELSGEAALAALQCSGREWPALMGVVDDLLGRGSAMRTGPLLSCRVGRFEMQGRRPTMEDQCAVKKLAAAHLARPASAHVYFLGLYDGHGGGACSEYAASHLHERLAASSAFGNGDISSAMTEAFEGCELDFFRDSVSHSGSCALVALLRGGLVHVAHVGDSRAVIARGERAVATALTLDHKPDEPSELARIEQLGGTVVFRGNCARITHSGSSLMLATSRSLGDRHFKESWSSVAGGEALDQQLRREAEEAEAKASGDPGAEAAAGAQTEATCVVEEGGVGTADRSAESAPGGQPHALELATVAPLLSASPTISSHELTADDRFVILGCDGVWDVLSDQQACDYVREALAMPNSTPDDAARRLVGEAYSAGSEDNISVLVALLVNELV